MTARATFYWGVLGAVAPQIIRFFLIAQAGGDLPKLNWTVYLLLLAVYVFCGGAVAVEWKPENEFKAIWVGASLPALIASLATPPSH